MPDTSVPSAALGNEDDDVLVRSCVYVDFRPPQRSIGKHVAILVVVESSPLTVSGGRWRWRWHQCIWGQTLRHGRHAEERSHCGGSEKACVSIQLLNGGNRLVTASAVQSFLEACCARRENWLCFQNERKEMWSMTYMISLLRAEVVD